VCRSVVQLNALTNAGAMLLAGLGGAVTPVELLPGWARAIAPLTPAYWAMRGFRSVLFDAGGLSSVLLPIGVLLGFSALFTLVAVRRFRVEEAKVSWA
jgi:ABC-2 type transport system permease protein